MSKKGLFHYRNRKPLHVQLVDGVGVVAEKGSVFLGYDPDRYTKPVKSWSAIVVNDMYPNGKAVIVYPAALRDLHLDCIGY